MMLSFSSRFRFLLFVCTSSIDTMSLFTSPVSNFRNSHISRNVLQKVVSKDLFIELCSDRINYFNKILAALKSEKDEDRNIFEILIDIWKNDEVKGLIGLVGRWFLGQNSWSR
ncbi:hypothetical protein RCL_jg11008.t1 [Rhizophagus clarus]|uniref:Uncharacterized protein n=1 Tax=Rhizophagus clarus TaxID=94130 RepID=A0A8H3MB56_9GLOM|nr:hypothetical protein RCL_jg11008.t1 [Rhizophagus clarus]